MKIVNVDDDPDDREMFRMAIEKIDADIDLIEIDSADAAIALLSDITWSPDFVFMDINMPRMNGYECVKTIHAFSNLKHTSIVMLSSTFYPGDQLDFGVLGIKYLLKTSSLQSLAASINGLIEARLLEEKLKI